MSSEYEVKKQSDGTVVVILHPRCKVSKGDIISLLLSAGVDVDDVVFTEPEAISSEFDFENCSAIIPMDNQVFELPELESAAQKCANAKVSVTVVFSANCEFEGIHSIANNYGNQCNWSPEELAVRLNQNDVPPLDSSGTIVNRSKASQVNCS